MSLAALKQLLDGVDEKTFCHGTIRLDERFALALPDGDVGAADDASFLPWLLAHAEPAPFGKGGQTVVDPKVRKALRLVDRDKIVVHGFDPASILDEIAAVLSPDVELKATLSDVVLYGEGGKFGRHKDTPRWPDLVGTLVVGLPVEHTGGVFEIDDGRDRYKLDWSGKQDPHALRWVALFSDIDHQVHPVISGTRVTLVYALTRTDKPRTDPAWEKHREQLKRTCARIAQSSDLEWPVMIACARHAIVDPKHPVSSIEVLRGHDREVADALTDAGLDVVVRSCITSGEDTYGDDHPRFPEQTWSIHRLKKPLTPEVIARMDDILTFSNDASDDEGNDMSEYSIGPHILDEISMDHWVVRGAARATLVHEASMFSEGGHFGNEAYEALIYTLAALEVTRPRSRGSA